jgi:starch phosphorylase
MRAGLRKLVPIFNAHRMVQDYTNRYYQPCSRRYAELCRDNMAGAREMARWRSRIMTGWGDVAVLETASSDGQERLVGDRITISAKVRLGGLSPEDVTVEAYFGILDPDGDFKERETAVLEPMGQMGDAHQFSGSIGCRKTGRFGYTVRVTPSHKRLENPFVMGLVKWA